ncbi:hypothetical protein AHAT_11840 [Agarivorans sp. Toyoura001]|nr:hypothetical protein AHAT_11840 [Agarivorans sp. Toyoura001]
MSFATALKAKKVSNIKALEKLLDIKLSHEMYRMGSLTLKNAQNSSIGPIFLRLEAMPLQAKRSTFQNTPNHFSMQSERLQH